MMSTLLTFLRFVHGVLANRALQRPVEIRTELLLPFAEYSGDVPVLPARMVNECQYCPRLVYFEWVQGEWADPRLNIAVESNHETRS